MDGVASHVSILKEIINIIRIDYVIEFGMGMNSTILFSDKIKNGISIEMQNKSWFDKMNSIINNNDLELKLMLGETEAIEFVKTLNKSIDLFFVDGHGSTRWDCINLGFKKGVPLIITHDTQQPTYGWNKINMPNDYRCQSYIHDEYKVGTTIFSKHNINQNFKDHKKIKFCWEDKS